MLTRQGKKAVNPEYESMINEELRCIKCLEPRKKTQRIRRIIEKKYELTEINSVLYKFLISFSELTGQLKKRMKSMNWGQDLKGLEDKNITVEEIKKIVEQIEGELKKEQGGTSLQFKKVVSMNDRGRKKGMDSQKSLRAMPLQDLQKVNEHYKRCLKQKVEEIQKLNNDLKQEKEASRKMLLAKQRQEEKVEDLSHRLKALKKKTSGHLDSISIEIKKLKEILAQIICALQNQPSANKSFTRQKIVSMLDKFTQAVKWNAQTPMPINHFQPWASQITQHFGRIRERELNEILICLRGTAGPKGQLAGIKEEIQKMRKKLDQLEEQNQQLMAKKSSISILRSNKNLNFLQSSILPTLEASEEIYRTQHFIINSIQSLYGKKNILFLSYLYGFQKFYPSKTNFHIFVDNSTHLLLIIKLSSGKFIGAYSQKGINGQKQVGDKGFMFQSKTETIFQQRERDRNKKIMPYSDYYIQVGNYDIKIKLQTTVVQSCISSQFSMFRPNNQFKSSHLLSCNDDQSKTELIDYQFYQVHFDE